MRYCERTTKPERRQIRTFCSTTRVQNCKPRYAASGLIFFFSPPGSRCGELGPLCLGGKKCTFSWPGLKEGKKQQPHLLKSKKKKKMVFSLTVVTAKPGHPQYRKKRVWNTQNCNDVGVTPRAAEEPRWASVAESACTGDSSLCRRCQDDEMLTDCVISEEQINQVRIVH